MLLIPEDEVMFYKERPEYYQLVQENLEKINKLLGNVEMTDNQTKTWLWLAGYEEKTIENILDVIEKVKR